MIGRQRIPGQAVKNCVNFEEDIQQNDLAVFERTHLNGKTEEKNEHQKAKRSVFIESAWSETNRCSGRFQRVECYKTSEKHPMKKSENGDWQKTAMLPAGRYEYKFLVDGQWWNDPKTNRLAKIASEMRIV